MTRNKDQQTFWADTVGAIWVRRTPDIDATFAPVLEAVLDAAALQTGEAVLDIGCGAGSSTLAAAQVVGSEGRACGLDISEPLLEAAQKRITDIENIAFIQGDAQVYSSDQARFDCMISRFGVMFFEDPHAAFRNIADCLTPDGRIAFATWGSIAQNPFFTLPAGLSKSYFGPMPKSDPDAPGPFAMREADKGIAMLGDAGFKEAAVTVQQMALTPKGTSLDVAEMLCEIGPAKSAFEHHQADADQRAAFVKILADALEGYATPKGIEIPAEINIFTARRG
jgi:SAM-dependent methyltransferase